MDIVASQKQISANERAQITQDVKADLIDHLYQGCLPGTITGLVISFLFYLDFSGFTPTYLLVGWLVVFDFMMVALSTLYFFYTKYKFEFSLHFWEWAYSITMCGCALAWLPCVYLMPTDLTRQYLGLILLFLATTGYATGTIGQFKLCFITLNLLLIPVIIWSFNQGGVFYNVIGVYSIIYFCFLLAINHRSTQWLNDSLKLKLENNLVTYQANHDLLTKLPNQRMLPHYIESATNLIKNTHNTFALVCFSLNRMEIINDSYGHAVGAALVQSVAHRLTALATRLSTDSVQYIITISRNDTFNILIVPLRLQEAEQKIKAFFSVLDEPYFIEGREVRMTASLGASFFPQDGQDAQSLWICADAAMLRAKQFGGNRLDFYKLEINAQMPDQLQLEADLHFAVKNKQMLVYYQPLVDLKTNQISGMEALLRWPHPIHGFISPMQFIPLAEATGLIVPLGEWVLHEACIQTLKWHKLGFDELKVAVNLSEKQLREENFIEVLQRVLDSTQLPPQFLELELTETSILDEYVIDLVKDLKKMKISLAIDDFGTGYSGLSYLKRFWIDKLKIDQSFIKDIPGNNDSVAIVSAIIAMAKELHVKILAEGVETAEQLNFLKSKGCDYIQGYYYSKPIDTDAFTQLLHKFQGIPSMEV